MFQEKKRAPLIIVMSNVLAAFSERTGAAHARAVKAAAAGAVLHDAEVEEIKQEEEIRNRKLTFTQKKMRRVMVVRKLSATTTNLAFVAGAGQGSIFSPGGVDGEVTSNPMNVFLRRFQRRARVGLEAFVECADPCAPKVRGSPTPTTAQGPPAG